MIDVAEANISAKSSLSWLTKPYRLGSLSIVLALFLSSSPAFPGDRELLTCAAKRIDSERLKCYDVMVESLTSEQTPSTNSFTPISDILADFRSMQGKDVTVNGTMIMFGQQGMLYSSLGSMTALFVEINNLPLDMRQKAFSRCGSGCEVAITGTVKKVLMNPGVDAQSITYN